MQLCDIGHPFQRLTKWVGNAMIVTMRLLVRRPIRWFFGARPPPADDIDLLEVATEVVENSLRKQMDPSLSPWSGFAWLKWYALAIVLAELCDKASETNTERAWALAESTFKRYRVDQC